MTADDTLWDLEERFWTHGADSARLATAKDAVRGGLRNLNR